MRELRVSLLTHELDADLQANNLASWWKELVDKDTWLTEKRFQEIAAMRKRLEELQAI
jgi:hypothetical protein